MSSFEPVLKFKNQKGHSERNKLTPLKNAPDPQPSLMDKGKAKKLVMLAKLIKHM